MTDRRHIERMLVNARIKYTYTWSRSWGDYLHDHVSGWIDTQQGENSIRFVFDSEERLTKVETVDEHH